MMTMKRTEQAETPEKAGLIWLSEAQIVYGKSRGWFTLRIRRGELDTVAWPGTPKVYLRRDQVEEALKAAGVPVKKSGPAV